MTLTTVDATDKPPATTGGIKNLDLRPTTPAERTATTWDMTTLWIGLIVGVPSYYIAGSLVEAGMSWHQGIVIVVMAKAILLIPLILTSVPGVRYGLPFPILARAAFGVRGAHIPALLRALIACGWFGIETWIGGQAFFLLLPLEIRSSKYSTPIPWLSASPLEFLTFLIFWGLQLTLLLNGMQGIRKLEKYSAPILILLALLLLSWAYTKAGGFGPMLSRPSKLSTAEFWELFWPSLTANVGSWAAVALSIPDFSRYARSQSAQVLGQLPLPIIMGSFSFIGLAVTSATEVIFGQTVSNPIKLLAMINGIGSKIIAVPGITLAIVTTNIPANVVAPANALVSFSPEVFTFKTGAVVTAVTAILFQPWRIFSSTDSFMYTWLVGYSAVMAPIAGVLLTDYYVIRRTVIDVDEMYCVDSKGKYYYKGGYNLVALVSVVLSIAPVVPGFLHKVKVVESLPSVLVFVYHVGWFFGLFSSVVIYLILCWCCRAWSWREGGGGGGGKVNGLCGDFTRDSLLQPL